MKTQNLRAITEAVSTIENQLPGFRTEHYVGSHHASQMAVREVIQQLHKHGWLNTEDTETLLIEQDQQWMKQWNFTPLGDGTAQSVDGSNGSGGYT